MKVVSILAVCEGDSDVLDAHLSFHLNAGVDLVLATDLGAGEDAAAVLAAYAAGDAVQVVDRRGQDERAWRTTAARRAVDEGADWILSVDADEFWWPRGESFGDVLAAIPPRYGIVQALVRVFPPARAGDAAFYERMTERPSLLHPEDVPEPLRFALRPLYRAAPGLVVNPDDGTDGGRRVPLRAWYPFEVLRFPFRSLEQTERRCAAGFELRSELEAAAQLAQSEGRLAAWYDQPAPRDVNLVPDERLRDALRRLAPAEPLVLRTPDVVDDASYAVECAAVGEVDLARLDRHLRELEERIGELEARFWPRVTRRISRLVRRS